MEKEDAIRRCCELAADLAKNGIDEAGSYEKRHELESLAYDNEVFIAYDDEWIAVEDDVFYFRANQ